MGYKNVGESGLVVYSMKIYLYKKNVFKHLFLLHKMIRSSQKIFRRYYHSRIIQHFENPKNVGSFPKKDPDVYTGLVGAPACGDVMKIQLKIQKGLVIDSKCKTFGCGSAIASSSYVSEYVKGKTVEEASKITNKEIAQDLHLPPVKLHCSMLAEDAIKEAMKKYRSSERAQIKKKLPIKIDIPRNKWQSKYPK